MLSSIPQASRELALQRLELLRPHLEGERPLRAIASEASIPYRTAYGWASGYRKDGLAALARKSRTDQIDFAHTFGPQHYVMAATRYDANAYMLLEIDRQSHKCRFINAPLVEWATDFSRPYRG